MSELSAQFGSFFDTTFLYFMRADIIMSEEEKKLSNERSKRYEKQYREYLDDQQRKYGGGYMCSSFDPINIGEEFVFKEV